MKLLIAHIILLVFLFGMTIFGVLGSIYDYSQDRAGAGTLDLIFSAFWFSQFYGELKCTKKLEKIK